MKTVVKLTGFRELETALLGLKTATAKSVMRRVALKALRPVASRASAMAPDDPATTGEFDLKANIKTGTRLNKRQARLARKQGKSQVEVYAGVTSDAPQGLQQEFGNVNHPPQPFMRPAWDSEHQGVLESVKTDAWIEIDKVAKRLAKRTAV